MNSIYLVAKEHLGDHLTLDPNVPEEVGCAESASFILKAAGYAIPEGGIPSVVGLITWLLAHGFTEETYPTVGAVITAHNKDVGITNGSHVGICMQFGIASNTSSTGIFSENYSYRGFDHYFLNLGSTIRYFTPVNNELVPPAQTS